MNVVVPKAWTIERFLDWAGEQDERYEFDGSQPVPMTGGNQNHAQIAVNILAALREKLRGKPCKCLGPDMGVRTTGDRIRYPDALITCTPFSGTDRLAPDVRVIFEVVSPSSVRTDRFDKVLEYRDVPTLLRYVIVDAAKPHVLMLHRARSDEAWNELLLRTVDVLPIPEAGIDLPIAMIYEDVSFGEPPRA